MTPCLPSLREALNISIASGRLEDTKIILYSRRDPSGVVCRPRALYASSHVLKTVPYFSDLLSGTFAETELKDLSQPIDESDCAEDYGYCSDSDLEDDNDAVKGETLKKTVTESAGKGTVIKVQDIAFITFQAFLLYLYTGSIEFAPFGSEENRKSRGAEIVSLSKDSIPRPSPKSIYRLADKYDIPSLKELALDSIRDGLCRCDIVEEVFSEFSSRYKDIEIVQTEHLVSVVSKLDDESAKALCEKIDEKVDSYANGDLDHAVDAMTLLWKLSKRDNPSPIPLYPVSGSCTPDLVSRGPIEIALIKSIREGTFFDRKYWARNSKAARALRPLYISSIAAGEHLSYIDDLVKPLREDESLDVDGGSEDSDYENGLEQASESTPEEKSDGKGKSESEQESLPVLTIGSFASWRSLSNYLCTNTIHFAPLKSQGADVREQYVQGQTTPDKPPPCSPKTIYSLASALHIRPLRYLAFEDIQSKITSENVVVEFFSHFTSQQGDIMNMQCDLLYYKFNNDTTTDEGVGFIKGMVGGNSAHRAGALKAGLREGLLNSAVLRPHDDCDFHNTASCGGSQIDSDNTSCLVCWKRFR